ncbi:MAG TPA: DUF4184 family protein [Microbacterium sp.]|nr:DUF4184 family protein [Microbacterium sp.]
MPFTPSHAVVALPFVRTRLIPAAIAVGAMAPDLPLFVRVLVPRYSVTHDLVWLPLTTLLALALLLVWRCVLRPAARELAPVWLAERLPRPWDAGSRAAVRETFPSGRGVVLLFASLALGVVSHIVWDLFTHEGRWGVSAIPALAAHWGPLTGFKWLQHGSSVVGLAIIAAWAVVWLARRMPGGVDRTLPGWVRWAWWVSLPAFLLVALASGFASTGPFTDEWTPAHLAYLVLPPACAAWGIGTLILAALIQLVRVRRIAALT